MKTFESELKEWFLYKSVSDDSDTMSAVPRSGSDEYDSYANMITVTEITAFEIADLKAECEALATALDNIATHQSMLAQTHPHLSVTYAIAMKALKNYRAKYPINKGEE